MNLPQGAEGGEGCSLLDGGSQEVGPDVWGSMRGGSVEERQRGERKVSSGRGDPTLAGMGPASGSAN